ncbi:hypothetical protein Bhyg_09932, partial [Pseudolycoriella hygida]
VVGIAFPIKSSRTITTVIPAGPIFFCAPPNIKPNFVMSNGRLNMFDDISTTNGTPLALGRPCLLYRILLLLSPLKWTMFLQTIEKGNGPNKAVKINPNK